MDERAVVWLFYGWKLHFNGEKAYSFPVLWIKKHYFIIEICAHLWMKLSVLWMKSVFVWMKLSVFLWMKIVYFMDEKF